MLLFFDRVSGERSLYRYTRANPVRVCVDHRIIRTNDFVHSQLRRIAAGHLTSDVHATRRVAQLVVAAGRSQSTADGDASGAAASACTYLYSELSRWIGSDGCHALFTRALAEARKESPPLQSIQLSARLVPYVQGIDTAVAAHGEAETAAGIEVLLIRLVELLGRLIGDDMAMKLIEPVLGKSENSRKNPVTRRGPE